MNKHIEEMVKVLVEGHHKMDVAWTNHFVDGERFPKPKGEHQILAEELYNAGYRKASQEGAECPTCHGTGRIGTTDWLTKNISKQQLAKEKAEAVAEHEAQFKRNVAREIFEDLNGLLIMRIGVTQAIAELKKKYESEGAE